MSEASTAPDTPTYDPDSYSGGLPHQSVHQTDARIFHQSDYRYDEVARVTDARFADARLVCALELASGATANLTVEVLAAEALRMVLCHDQQPATVERDSDMLVPFTEGSAVTAECRIDEERIAVQIGDRELVIQRDGGFLEIRDRDGRAIFASEDYPLAGKPLVGHLGFRSAPGTEHAQPYLSWRIRNDERFFGLGEKWNRVEKTGSRATIWASDTCGSNSCDLSYKSLPYLLSSRGWGLFLHSSWRSHWEVGNFSYVSGSLLSEDDHLDAFLFFGDGFAELIRVYTALTGRPRPIPDWAFGLWMSRCQYASAAEAEEAMDGLRERGIPADVIHLDPLWMRTHYYFQIGVDACDFVKNAEHFPDLPGLWQRWRTNGFKTCLWINPYLPEGSAVYAEAEARGYLVRDRSGGIARLSHGEAVGVVDFTHPEARAWWRGHLEAVLREGAAVLKPDYGDRIPESARFHDGRSGAELHNLYLFWYTETCYQACVNVHGYGLVWRRAGYIGSQRYPGTWAGDTRSTWEEMLACLRGGLAAGFNGEAFWASDIAGFTGPAPSPELYIRWAQWGLLSPLARFHGANSPREPWHFGDTAVAVVRHYARLRYRLLPYLKACAEQAYASGLPLMRHLHLACPDEPGTEFIDDQYLLGDDLLVAPVFAPGATARRAYVPRGEWVAFEEPDQRFTGPAWHELPAPLERIPLLRRAGVEIPMLAEAPAWIE